MAWTSRAGRRSRRRDTPPSTLRAPRATAGEAGDGARRPRTPLADLVGSWEGTTLVLVGEPEALTALREDLSTADTEIVHLWERDPPSAWMDEEPLDTDAEFESDVDPSAAKPRWSSVLVVTLDRSTLRRAASELPELPRVTDLGVWLAAHRRPIVVVPHAGWAPLRRLEALQLPRPERGVLLRLSFASSVHPRPVLQEVARQAVPTSLGERSALVTAYAGRRPAPGLDLHAAGLGDVSEAVDPDRVVPPDVVVAAPGTSTGLPTHPILARPPVVVTDPGIEPVDEMVYSPRGWRRTTAKGDVDLADVLPHGVVTEQTVRRLRDHRSVRVDLGCTTVADLLKLTMAGVPTIVTGTPQGVAPEVTSLLADVPDLGDPLAREGWSVKLRRATFDHHSTLAWRHGLSVRAGVRDSAHHAGLPGVSILLATKREHELEGAVARVAAQVGAEVELVVATHGFVADRDRLADVLGRELVLLSHESDVLFGDVLTNAARAASHDVVMKMDDDDWYSPHTVHDLLMARRYSGADVVGSAAEFVHLEETDETLWRTNVSERSTSFVAGGTILLSRDLLREVGWFRPVRRWVDAQLLERVRASGGTIYRSHGLNYVLHRHGRDHTWAEDPDNFRAPGTVERVWPGFRPPQEAL